MSSDSKETAPGGRKERVRRRELPTIEIDPAAVDVLSPVPAYLQVEQDLRRHIQASGFQEDARLPRETELARLYGISRMTLRNALSRLEEAKLLRREHGVGTLVNPQTRFVTCDLSLMKRLQTQIIEQGFEPSVLICQRRTVVPVQTVREALAMAENGEAHFVERLLSVDRRPTALIRTWVPLARFPGFDQGELHENSVWKTMEAVYGRRMVRTSNALEMVRLGARESHQMGAEEGESVIRLAGTAYDADRQPCEYSEAFWGRTARIRFEADA